MTPSGFLYIQTDGLPVHAGNKYFIYKNPQSLNLLPEANIWSWGIVLLGYKLIDHQGNITPYDNLIIKDKFITSTSGIDRSLIAIKSMESGLIDHEGNQNCSLL